MLVITTGKVKQGSLEGNLALRLFSSLRVSKLVSFSSLRESWEKIKKISKKFAVKNKKELHTDQIRN